MALVHLAELDLQRYRHDLFLPRIWALRHNVTAAYVALAESLDVPLLTTDWHLAGASGVRARIELIA